MTTKMAGTHRDPPLSIKTRVIPVIRILFSSHWGLEFEFTNETNKWEEWEIAGRDFCSQDSQVHGDCGNLLTRPT